jgi:hypothetical protein
MLKMSCFQFSRRRGGGGEGVSIWGGGVNAHGGGGGYGGAKCSAYTYSTYVIRLKSSMIMKTTVFFINSKERKLKLIPRMFSVPAQNSEPYTV